MAADYARMVAELQAFFDFTGKVVILVGAGAGKFIDACRGAKRLIAVDRDAEVLGQFERAIRVRGLQDKASVICAEFLEVAARGDVVYFEFCFHEMEDPQAALRHACDLAPEVLVFDHLPGSAWTYYTNEEDKVRRSTGVNSGGLPSGNDCSGMLSIDMNSFAAGLLGGTPSPALLVVGTDVWCQWWSRDPGFPAPNNSSLSNALTYRVCN